MSSELQGSSPGMICVAKIVPTWSPVAPVPLKMCCTLFPGTRSDRCTVNREGDLNLGVVSTGQCVGLAHDIPTVKELFDRIMKEAEGIVNRIKVV